MSVSIQKVRLPPDTLSSVNPTRRSALKTVLLGSLLKAQDAPHRDTLDLDSEHQTIENFGASDCWSMQKLGAWSLTD